MGDSYTALARASFEAFVNRGERIRVPDDVPAELRQRQAACFVSLHKAGELRGCIGTLAPTRACLADEIIDNAISAATRDPRFSPVRPDELALLHCGVDVLSQPEPIDGPEQLDVARFGVIVANGWRRGVLLPALEGVDTVEQQLAIARQKAGIGAREPVELQRFEVVRHEE